MKKLLSIITIIGMAILFVSCDKPTISNDGQTATTQMSWSEAFHYANMSTTHQGRLTAFGIVFFIAAIAFAYMVWVKKKDWAEGWQKTIFFVLLVIGTSFILILPNKVRMNNSYRVPTQYFKDSGQTHILDSLFKNNLMVDAAVK